MSPPLFIEEVAQAKCSDGGVFQETLPKGLVDKANNHQSPPPQAVPLLLQKQEEDYEHVFNILKIKDLSPPLFIEEVAQAKRRDGGVFQETLPKGLVDRANNHQSPPPQAVPLLLLKQEEDYEHVFNILKIKELSPPLFIEEVAQAKRSDGGVFQEALPKGLVDKANNYQSPPPQAVPILYY